LDTLSGHAPYTDEEKLAVEAQLERLLATSFFSHSRRFPAFLRYVVDKTLAGDIEQLKERTLGIEIFGKGADYDTATDPIVRVTAAEIRKRIALYYQEPGREQELRLSLPLGSYVPQFHPPDTEPAVLDMHGVPGNHGTEPIDVQTRRGGMWAKAAIAVVAVFAVALSGFLIWQHQRRSAFAEFWNPITGSSDPVLFCVADQPEYKAITLRDAADPSHAVTLQDTVNAVVIDDLSTITKIAGVLQTAGKRYTLRGASDTALMDLRAGPAVIVGAFDNAWALRLLQPLRYHFANDPAMTKFSIVDANQSNKALWTVDRTLQLATNNYRDFAIVARFYDATTGKPALIAAGIGRGGTIAAGEFLTSSDLLRSVQQRRPPGKQNVEVVLSTQIINGEPGTPTVEAVYFW
jgi:hypothetical protein